MRTESRSSSPGSRKFGGTGATTHCSEPFDLGEQLVDDGVAQAHVVLGECGEESLLPRRPRLGPDGRSKGGNGAAPRHRSTQLPRVERYGRDRYGQPSQACENADGRHERREAHHRRCD